MRSLLAWIPGRLLPALVTAAGVVLLTAGLLTYQDAPEAVAAAPLPAPSPGATEPLPTLLPIPTLTPSASAAPSSGPAPARIASRVVVSALRIDLPVVRPPDDPNHFPYCNVAEYRPEASQPGSPGTTYLYAHARDGMFLPLLLKSRIDKGSAMLGMLVQVYTSDNQLFLYEITRVLRHQSEIYSRPAEELALQTSEGPAKGYAGYTGLVLIVVAQPLSVGPADPKAANPVAKPVACE
ncbi:MAG: hypothetical protein ABIG85_07295 [Chloroflexota bacterium]